MTQICERRPRTCVESERDNNVARILIANDDCDLLVLRPSLLEEEGHSVDIVANGKEAIRLESSRTSMS